MPSNELKVLHASSHLVHSAPTAQCSGEGCYIPFNNEDSEAWSGSSQLSKMTQGQAALTSTPDQCKAHLSTVHQSFCLLPAKRCHFLKAMVGLPLYYLTHLPASSPDPLLLFLLEILSSLTFHHTLPLTLYAPPRPSQTWFVGPFPSSPPHSCHLVTLPSFANLAHPSTQLRLLPENKHHVTAVVCLQCDPQGSMNEKCADVKRQWDLQEAGLHERYLGAAPGKY